MTQYWWKNISQDRRTIRSRATTLHPQRNEKLAMMLKYQRRLSMFPIIFIPISICQAVIAALRIFLVVSWLGGSVLCHFVIYWRISGILLWTVWSVLIEVSYLNISPNISVAPLYQMAYDPDQLREKQKSAIECLKKVRNAVKKVNKFKYCFLCLESGYGESHFPLPFFVIFAMLRIPFW